MKTTMQNDTDELIPAVPNASRLKPSDLYITGGNFADTEDRGDDSGVQEELFHSKKHGFYLRRSDGHAEFRKLTPADVMRWMIDRHMIKTRGIRKEFHAILDAAGIGGKMIQTAR